jgi:MoCo/4Fe-4S cofactor protein with predicted Tat translocation signal
MPIKSNIYWRSLDELTRTPDLRAIPEREFADGANEFTDPVSRRHFTKIMSASFLLAGLGLTGCRRPEQKILPFAKQLENYVHGAFEYYATSIPTRSGAVPLLVRSNDGRPTKVEGNPEHPANKIEGGHKHGGTDHFAQASLLTLYDPDRALHFRRPEGQMTRETAYDFLAQLGNQYAAKGGKGLAFLVQRNASPSRARLIEVLRKKLPDAKWYVHEPVDFHIHQEAASMAFGQPVNPVWRLDQGQVILSLDCDFIGSEENTAGHCRDFARSRNPDRRDVSMNRLYAIEPMLTLTGCNADHRLRLAGSAVTAATAFLARKMANLDVKAEGLDEKTMQWLEKCAEDLLKLENKGSSLVLAGYSQPLSVHLLAWAMNSALGNIGKTVFLHETVAEYFGTLSELRESLKSGAVETLVIAGGNPAYDAPVDLDWVAAQRLAKTVVRWGYYEDETGLNCHYHFPATHYLESWGDARSYDGTLVSVQPLIAPLFDGITELEFFARIAGLDKPSPYEVVRETFRAFVPNSNFEEDWKKFLYNGFLDNTSPKTVTAQLNLLGILRNLRITPVPPLSKSELEVVFHRDYKLDDGRWNNNGWLQEMPDPISKLTWDNAAMLSPKTAQDLGLLSKDVQGSAELRNQIVRITVGDRTIEAPAWVQPGQADNVIALALGYGRTQTGRIGKDAGFNAYALRSSTAPYFASGAKLILTSKFQELACTQTHGSQEGRPMVREGNLNQYRDKPEFAKGQDWEKTPEGPTPMYPNPLDVNKSDRYQWGMSIDLNACVGCHACVLACQSENNIPIVGKLMVSKRRDMHWLRLDRYYAGTAENPQVVNQPMLCQHCEAAPCENVCPVNATVHDNEGLNLMVYNRCVGTRYCSNNCPWKVRRFNFFDYNRRPLGKDLYKSPLVTKTDGEWEFSRWMKDPARGSKAEDEWDLVRMAKNPNVTVRMRGVMEKCTFCVQRIEEAKIAQKVKARDSGDVLVPEGSFTTACAQACPADAIVFGNLLDPKSRVSQLKKHARDYTTLEFLNTRPRVTYLARIRNPNPEMPDYHELPLSIEKYEQVHHENPFEKSKE